MEIVVNRCFGGFGLSKKAHERLEELGVQVFKTWKDLKESKQNGQLWIVKSGIMGDPASNADEHRTSELVISVVKELGEEANGMCAELEIVEIPDDIDYVIDEYDGNESVHEKHRSW